MVVCVPYFFCCCIPSRSCKADSRYCGDENDGYSGDFKWTPCFPEDMLQPQAVTAQPG